MIGRMDIYGNLLRRGLRLVPSLIAFVFYFCWVICGLSHAQDAEASQLQIINGTGQVADVYVFESQGVREFKVSIQPYKDVVISTHLGEMFEVCDSKKEPIEKIVSQVRVQAVRLGGIPDFYTQQFEAKGFPIVASSRVNSYALKEAAYIIDGMLKDRMDIREAMIKSGARLCILAHDEFTTDQPEWQWLARDSVAGFPGVSGKDFYDARARGMGGSKTDPYCSCGEENLLCYPGDPYSTESILIHEFAHNIHLRGMVNLDPTFDQRVKAAYDRAIRGGLWRGKYASVNHHEYFAEGVQSWFDNNRQDDHDHNHVDTRLELIEYDVGLAELCREVFGDSEFRYTKPQTRVEEHLRGYQAEQAPSFRWPDRLKSVQREIIRQAKTRPQN